MHGLAVIGEQGVQEGAEHVPLWGPSVEDQRSGGVVSYLQNMGGGPSGNPGPSCTGRGSDPGPQA